MKTTACLCTTLLVATMARAPLALAQDCPEFVGAIDTPGNAIGIAVSGGYAFVADGDTLRVIDVSDPSAPEEVGFCDTPESTRAVDVSGGFAYVADRTVLRVIDVSDPSAPVEVSQLSIEDIENAGDIEVAGGHAYLVCRYSGLRVIDVSNPYEPQEISFYDTSRWAFDVAVLGSYAFVTDDWDGLLIIDVSTPSEPRVVVSYYIPAAERMAVAPGYAYVMSFEAWTCTYGLGIYDVSTPSSPFGVGGLFPAATLYLTDITVSAGHAYVTDSLMVGSPDAGHLRVIDVSDPSAPVVVGDYVTGGAALGVAVSGDYVYVADGSAGMAIFRGCTPLLSDGFESGDTSAWSSAVP